MIGFVRSRWQPIASIVTMAPFATTWASSAGSATISFSWSATRRWPSTIPASVAHAEMVWRAACPCHRSCDRRAVLPSMAMIGAASRASGTRVCIQSRSQAANGWGSSSAKTRPKVSWEGIP